MIVRLQTSHFTLMQLVKLLAYVFFQLTSKDIAESIDNEMDGDLQKAFLTLGE